MTQKRTGGMKQKRNTPGKNGILEKKVGIEGRVRSSLNWFISYLTYSEFPTCGAGWRSRLNYPKMSTEEETSFSLLL